jgi:hypothetical protein
VAGHLQQQRRFDQCRRLLGAHSPVLEHVHWCLLETAVGE